MIFASSLCGPKGGRALDDTIFANLVLKNEILAVGSVKIVLAGDVADFCFSMRDQGYPWIHRFMKQHSKLILNFEKAG